MMKKIDSEKITKAKTIVSDGDFRKHMKDSVSSAAKAGMRARSVSRPKKNCKKKLVAAGVLVVSLVAVAAVVKSGISK